MKIRLFVTLITCTAMLIAACSDDDPVAPKKTTGPSFNTSKMPILVPNTTAGSAGLALDGANNLICATFNGVLYSVSRTTGELSIKAANIGITEGGPFRMMSCVYNPAADRFYTGDISSRIFTVNPSTGDSELLVNLGSSVVNQLLMAPAGFGAYGGQLIAFTNSSVTAVDPGNPGSPVDVVGQGFVAADFSPNGTLYAADYYGGRVVTISPAGVVTTFLSGINSLEGLAINPAGNRMYLASTSAPNDSIFSVTIPGGEVATLPFGPELQGGSYTTGMVVYANKLFWAADSADTGEALYLYYRDL